jgi:uncharacterized membrane protein
MATYVLGDKIIAKQNNSIRPEGFVWLFVSIVMIASIITIAMSLIGAWLALPFVGLEVLAFAFAFYHVYIHYNDYDSISLKDDSVVIEKRVCKSTEKFTFQRYWVKVTLRNLADGTCGIFIGSHGKEVEFGRRYMDDVQRTELVKQLKVQLANVY